MALICALPEEYSSFVSSLMLIDELDCNTIHEAFRNEQLNHEQCSIVSSDATSTTALATNPKNISCKFCGYKGHVLEQCRKYNMAKVEAQKPK